MRIKRKTYRKVMQWPVFFFLFIAFGCSVISPTDPYRGLPPRNGMPPDVHTASADSPPLQTDGTEITLDQAIEIALANNPELAAASFDVDAAQARNQGARGALWPSISAEADYARHLDDQRLIPARYNGELGTFGDDLFAGDLLVRVPLFTGGKLVNQARAADFFQQAAAYDMARTREELIFNVSSIFYGILAQERLIKSLEFSANALEGHLKRINDMVNAQKAALVDRLRTEVRLSSVKTSLVRETNVLKIQHRVLATLMGIHHRREDLRISGALKQNIPELESPEHLTKKAMKHRPDYQSARKKLEAQARQVDIARAGYSPDIGLIGAYGMRWAVDPAEQPPDTRDSEDVGRVGVNIALPLFEGGQTRARVQEEHARLAAAQKRLRNLEFQIRLDIETALANMTSAYERAQTSEKTVEQASESLRIEREKYELGRGVILDVLDAQAALLESETNYYQALADINIAIAQLSLSTGGSFQDEHP